MNALVRFFWMKKARRIIAQRRANRIVGTIISPGWNGPITWATAEALMMMPWPMFTTVIIYDKRFHIRPNTGADRTANGTGEKA